MHIKRDISIWNLKTILNVLFPMPGFSGRSKRVLTICLLSATIQIKKLSVKVRKLPRQVKERMDLASTFIGNQQLFGTYR